MFRNFLRPASLVLAGIAFLASGVILNFVESSGDDEVLSRRLTIDEESLATNFGAFNPNYAGFESNDVCSGQNLANPLQKASYDCTGFPRATCISCVPGVNQVVEVSGLGTGAGTGTYQPSGATNGSCSNYELWYGECVNPGGNYSCNAMIQSGGNCVGTYPRYDMQVGSPVVQIPDSVKDPTIILLGSGDASIASR